jgi:hypothetical protein
MGWVGIFSGIEMFVLVFIFGVPPIYGTAVM